MINYRLDGLRRAAGLEPEEAEVVGQLVRTYHDNLGRNQSLLAYYEDENPVTMFGIAVPGDVASRVGCRTGWAAKSVDYLASRSIFDGYTAKDADVAEFLAGIVSDNMLVAEYAKAVPSELVYGCGFWTVSQGGDGEQDTIVNYHSALHGSVIMNHRAKREAAGLYIEDWETMKNGNVRPSRVVVHMEDRAVVIDKVGKCWQVTGRGYHNVGRPLMVAMAYRPTETKLGKTRISKCVRSIINEAQREIVRTSWHSEVSSAPLRYLFGVSEDAFEADKYSLAYNALMMATKDEDGDVPTVGQLEASSPSGHVAVMEHLMGRMSGETGIPVSSFGLKSAGYQSSDALRASSDDLILEAEALCRSNGEALVNVALIALALRDGKSIGEVGSDSAGICAHWRDPSMPSVAALSDAMVKQASIVGWLPETSVYWEKLGYSEDERMRIANERESAKAASSLNAILLGQNVKTEAVDADTARAAG